MKNSDRPAYPRSGYELSNLADHQQHYHEVGMSKREIFAMAAMQGILSDCETQREIKEKDNRFNGMNFNTVVALNSIEFADELLKQLDTNP